MGGPPFRRRRLRTSINESETTNPSSPSNGLSSAAPIPALHETVYAKFFAQCPVPSFIPTSAHDAPPDCRHITRSASDTSLRRLRWSVLLDVAFGSLIHLHQQARDIAAHVHGHLRALEDGSVARIDAKDLAGAAGQPYASAPPSRYTSRDAPLPPPPAPPRNITTSVA
ncbi:hypothetical protein BKA70DRAFT_1426982 [Coprinopsis sp. MPI-PUGE-AT-0042]|nr:hypothetical protein BKA70DRAFT_1426982 [Coprinopsis sp. MPI-PUGE-AT-0042]